jgi:hypothetical protein
MSWVSVKKELPKESTRFSSWVLVIVDEHFHSVPDFLVAAYDTQRGEWVDYEGFPLRGVTHWMEVKAPESENDWNLNAALKCTAKQYRLYYARLEAENARLLEALEATDKYLSRAFAPDYDYESEAECELHKVVRAALAKTKGEQPCEREATVSHIEARANMDSQVDTFFPDDEPAPQAATAMGPACPQCGGTFYVCNCQVEELRRELAEARERNEHTYCAYCEFDVPLSDPDAMTKVHDHVLNCEHHPLGIKVRELREQLERQNADPIWRACERLYDAYYRDDQAVSGALAELIDAWNRMLG